VVLGGTSAVAPLWAALVARLAQQTGTKLGLLQPVLYDGVKAGVVQAGFQDITSGSNGSYSAGPGWDACTGLGSPDGAVLPGLFTAGTSTGTGTSTTGADLGAGVGAGGASGDIDIDVITDTDVDIDIVTEL
jgi:subtilase family serine protease